MVLYALVSVVLFVYAVLDVLRSPARAVRTLPKAAWFLVILPPVFGPLAWLLAGRPRPGDGVPPPAAAAPLPPDDDPEFLRELRRRAQEQRRRSRDPRDDVA